MIINPRYKNYICLTSHPKGCYHNIIDQIEYVKQNPKFKGIKNVLVIGSSTGYGLASRVAATFGGDANTLGIMFEKPSKNKSTATAGWYNTASFESLAIEDGYYAKTINGDAFSNEIKTEAIDLIKKDLGKIDLVVYSIASPRRKDPISGEIFHSTLKPIKDNYSNKTLDFHKCEISEVNITPANHKEIEDTIKVMGGEDWQLWLSALSKADVLSPEVKTIAYTYVGPEITHPIYRGGTIGRAKEHLENTASQITNILKPIKGSAYVVSCKALVTQSSSAIPVVPLYISLLMKIMKEKGVEENCIQQIYRLFTQKLYTSNPIELDNQNLIRLDDFELSSEIQNEVLKTWNKLDNSNVNELTDLSGFKNEFLKLFGFNHPKVDYTEDVEHNIPLPSSSK